MDEKFQDRIDDFLLNRMEDADKEVFLQEVEQDKGKKEQLEFTKNVKDSIRSREEKFLALAQFQKQYEEERRAALLRPTGTDAACHYPAPEVVTTKPVRSRKRIWLWISGVAAMLVVGFFAIKPMFVYDSSPNYNQPLEQIRGGEDVFDSCVPVDSMDKDTVKFDIEKKIVPDE